MIKKIVDLILYGNYWIAICALAMLMQTELFTGKSFHFSTLTIFVFFATFFLYAIHRIVGISKLSEFYDVDRYQVIARFKSHILIYAVIASVGCLYYFYQLDWAVKIALVVPAILALGYVIPFLGNRRRLRDLNHIKIYLIAIVWAWVTVGLPALSAELLYTLPFAIMTIERAVFIFAITLPFDIRDLKVDNHSNVKTIPAVIGVPRTKQIGIGLISLFMVLVSFNYYLGTYLLADLLALFASAISTGYFIWLSDQKKHDYFFSGLMDGTMLLQFLLVSLGRVF